MREFKFYMRLILIVFVMSCQTVFAAHDDGYCWYNIRVSAFPTGKGLVYATNDYDDDVEPEESNFSDEVVLKFVEEGEARIKTYNKPKEGYQFNGWYSYLSENNVPQVLRTQDSYFGDIFDPPLYYNWSDNDDEEHYPEEPDEIIGAFGKVGCNATIVIDNFIRVDSIYYLDGREFTEEDTVGFKTFALSYVFGDIRDDICPSIDNPANDVGDKVTLTTIPYFDYMSSEEGETEYVRLSFKNWTDTQGNTYEDIKLEVEVKDLETYTAHYKLERMSTGIAGIYLEKEARSPVYDLQGRKVRPFSRQKGLYVRKGKKYLRAE